MIHQLVIVLSVLGITLAADGDVTLVGGSDANRGLVMIEYKGAKGTVCNDDWNVYAADVVCKQVLGTSTSKSTARYLPAEGSTPEVYLTKVECGGDEEKLMDCVHDPLGESGGCAEQDGAGVICWNPDGFEDYANDHGVLRLTGGPTSSEGRVEVYIDGSWGSVCDEKWSVTDATVLCKQLGCIAAKEGSTGSKYGPGVLPIKVTDVECDGTEEDLIKCPNVLLFLSDDNTTCTHQTEAGAICNCGATVTIGDGEASQGLLKVQLAGEAEDRSLCSDGFDLRSADVACREAGFPGALSFSTATGNITGPVLQVSCSGTEISLRACPMFNTTLAQCNSGKGVEVTCQPKEAERPTEAPGTTKPPGSGGLSTGAIVGIVIGCLLGLVLILILAFCLCRKRREGPAAI